MATKNNPKLDSPETEISLDRRNFLCRSGLAGAVVTVLPSTLLATPNAEGSFLISAALIKKVVAALTKDTMAGLVSFMVPGNDLHSISQRQYTLFQRGGLAADTDDFMVEGFNQYMKLPDLEAADLLGAAAQLYSDQAGPLPSGIWMLLAPLEQYVLKKLNQHIEELQEDNEYLPLATIFALLLNILASGVDPFATGLHISPFSRLDWSQKAEVFRRFETELPDIIAAISARLGGEMDDKISGLIQFAAGAMLQFSAFGSYSEWQLYNPDTGVLQGRPVGWDISQYLTNGPVEGWDDFIGYYQDRRQANA